MEKRKIRIDQGRVIPMFPRLLVTSLLVALLIYLMDQSLEPGPFFFLGLVTGSVIIHATWTTRKMFVADQDESKLSNYYWFLGAKVHYREFSSRGINMAIRRKRRGHKTPGRYPWEVYLVLENGSEEFVISRNYEEDAEKVASKIAKKLGLEETKK